MNVYWLDPKMEESVKCYTDDDLFSVLFTLEKFIATALIFTGYKNPGLITSIFERDPIIVWMRNNYYALDQGRRLSECISKEMDYRFNNSDPESIKRIRNVDWEKAEDLCDFFKVKAPPVKMGAKYRCENLFESYRNFYTHKKIDGECDYTKRYVPDWYHEKL